MKWAQTKPECAKANRQKFTCTVLDLLLISSMDEIEEHRYRATIDAELLHEAFSLGKGVEDLSGGEPDNNWDVDYLGAATQRAVPAGLCI